MCRPWLIAGTLILGRALALTAAPPEPTLKPTVRAVDLTLGEPSAGEPAHVDGGESPLVKKIYYHYGLDIGGAEGLVDVVAATDGLVVSAGTEVLPGYGDTPAKPRYDVVYVLDARGWYYRYSHLHTIA